MVGQALGNQAEHLHLAFGQAIGILEGWRGSHDGSRARRDENLRSRQSASFVASGCKCFLAEMSAHAFESARILGAFSREHIRIDIHVCFYRSKETCCLKVLLLCLGDQSQPIKISNNALVVVQLNSVRESFMV